MNNENQNLNNGVVPNPTPNPAPTPEPVGNPVPPVAPTPVQAPPVEPTIQPAAPVPPTPSPIPPVDVNLQPEGVVPPVAPAAPTPNAPLEPLMGTSLNDQTVLNPQNNQQAPMGAPVPPVGPGMPPPVNNMGMIGGVPTPPAMPPANNEKPKKKMNTPLLIILVAVLIIAIGFGVWYFLLQGNTKTTAKSTVITPTLKNVELGTEVVKNAMLFGTATNNGKNVINDCTVDTDLDTSKVGSYQYTITCGSVSSGPQIIEVRDTTSPYIVSKNVAINLDGKVSAEDFIAYANEESTYEFVEKDTEKEVTKVSEIDFSEAGSYTVQVRATDQYNNTTDVLATLVIDENAPEYYMVCEKDVESETFTEAEIKETYQIGISLSGTMFNALKNREYVFEIDDEYEEAKESALNNAFDDIEGTVIQKDEDNTISITVEETRDDLARDFDEETFSEDEYEIEDYLTDQGYSCRTE